MKIHNGFYVRSSYETPALAVRQNAAHQGRWGVRYCVSHMQYALLPTEFSARWISHHEERILASKAKLNLLKKHHSLIIECAIEQCNNVRDHIMAWQVKFQEIVRDNILKPLLLLPMEEKGKDLIPKTGKKKGIYHSFRRIIRNSTDIAPFFIDDLAFEEEDYCMLSKTLKLFNKQVIQVFGDKINLHDMQTLTSHQWLNDVILNTFCRACARKSGGRCAFLSSFFVSKISQGDIGIRAGKKWLRKANALESSRVAFPINVNGNHWAIGAFNLQEKCVEYYDSMSVSQPNKEVILLLCNASQLLFECDHKWSLCNTISFVPQQTNYYDCGVFACRFYHKLCQAECAEFTFSQKNMDASRMQIALNLISMDGTDLPPT